jgi:hypothetical protein
MSRKRALIILLLFFSSVNAFAHAAGPPQKDESFGLFFMEFQRALVTDDKEKMERLRKRSPLRESQPGSTRKPTSSTGMLRILNTHWILFVSRAEASNSWGCPRGCVEDCPF